MRTKGLVEHMRILKCAPSLFSVIMETDVRSRQVRRRTRPREIGVIKVKGVMYHNPLNAKFVGFNPPFRLVGTAIKKIKLSFRYPATCGRVVH